jgi:hypothetical protein
MMSFEECQEWGRRMRAEKEAFEKKQMEIRNNELRKQGIDPSTMKPIASKKPHEYDHPSMPDDGFVTFSYIIGMIASLIFTQWYIAWFGLTIAYSKFITRHDND